MLNRQVIKDEDGTDNTLDERLPSLKLLETEIERFSKKAFHKLNGTTNS